MPKKPMTDKQWFWWNVRWYLLMGLNIVTLCACVFVLYKWVTV